VGVEINSRCARTSRICMLSSFLDSETSGLNLPPFKIFLNISSLTLLGMYWSLYAVIFDKIFVLEL